MENQVRNVNDDQEVNTFLENIATIANNKSEMIMETPYYIHLMKYNDDVYRSH